MAGAGSNIIQEIQHKIDIVDLISQYIPLQRSGANYKGLCPFHEEKTPSFNVSPEKQLYYCFGCKEGGNVFHFVMAMEHISFKEALQLLAQRVGIDLDEHEDKGEITTLLRIHELAAKFFQKMLHDPRNKRALEYLKERHISSESLELFRIGFAPDNWDSLLSYCLKKGIPLSLLEKAGLVAKRKDGSGFYDRFRNRIIFPIQDFQERVVAFGGRTVSEDNKKVPKYLNSPESEIFHKGSLLYGFPQAKEGIQKEGWLAIVEGYTDVIMCRQFGIQPVVATLGTAFTSDHGKWIRRFVNQVYLIFDSDLAGQKAALKSITILLEEELDVKIVLLEPGMDPCDFLLKYGREAFEERIYKGMDFLDFYFDSFAKKPEGANLSSLSAKGKFLEDMIPLLKQMRNPLVLDVLVQRISELLQISPQGIYNKLQKSGGKTTKSNSSFQRNPESRFKKRESKGPKPKKEELFIFQSLFRLAPQIHEILEVFPPSQFEYPLFQKIVDKLKDWNPSWTPNPVEILSPEEQQAIAPFLMENETGYKKEYSLPMVFECIQLLEAKKLQKELEHYKILQKQAYQEGNMEELQKITQKIQDLRRDQERRKLTLQGKRLR
ncbi:MAG: DNA primase, partial [Planctomycetota bacterium]